MEPTKVSNSCKDSFGLTSSRLICRYCWRRR